MTHEEQGATAKKHIQISLQLPPALLEKVDADAERNFRSRSGHILKILTEYFKHQEEQQGS